MATERAAGGVLAVEGEVRGFHRGDPGLQAGNVELAHPDLLVGAMKHLADVGEADPEARQLFELRRREPRGRQSRRVKRRPEGIAGTRVVGASPGGRRFGRRPAEDDSQPRSQDVG